MPRRRWQVCACWSIGWPGRTRVSPGALVTLALGIGVAVFDFPVAQRAGGASYGGQFLNSPPLGEYALTVGHNLLILGFVASGWLVPWLVWAARGRLSRRDRVLGAVTAGLAVLLIVPQVLLYSREGIFEGKYELPAAIGVAGWVVAGLAWLRRHGSWAGLRRGAHLLGRGGRSVRVCDVELRVVFR